jgi:purine-binding chemotaxis protein CheW
VSRGKRVEPIDWAALRERLARVDAAIAEAAAPSPERARSLLDERARALARPIDEAPAPGEMLELVAFALGRERYAIESRFVREVSRLLDLTPVPGAPALVRGVTHLRGEILAVVDLRRLFRAGDPGVTDLSRLIVLGAGEPELGILADEVHALEHLAAGEVRSPPEPAGLGRAYLRGVTREALVVLDGDALLASERLFADSPEAAPRT